VTAPEGDRRRSAARRGAKLSDERLKLASAVCDRSRGDGHCGGDRAEGEWPARILIPGRARQAWLGVRPSESREAPSVRQIGSAAFVIAASSGGPLIIESRRLDRCFGKDPA
jgi:hypothetical protein